LTGTDVNGDSQTEVITLTGSATAHAGTKFFKTITAASASAQPAANVSIGMSDSAAEVIFAGRSRLKGAYIVNSATAGTLDFLTTSPTGTSVMKLGTVASATVTRDVHIPEEGVLFTNGVFVQYTVATFTTLTAFHA
jgi:hypothetical protein